MRSTVSAFAGEGVPADCCADAPAAHSAETKSMLARPRETRNVRTACDSANLQNKIMPPPKKLAGASAGSAAHHLCFYDSATIKMSARRPGKFPASEQMQVQMKDGLSRAGA